MPKSKLLIAICEGQYVDEGVASEIAHFITKGYGPVIGIRTDFRPGENLAAPINPAVLEYFGNEDHVDSRFFNGPDSYNNAIDYMQRLIQGMLEQRNK